MALTLDFAGFAFIALVASMGVPLVAGIWWPRATKVATYVTVTVMFFAVLITWMYSRNVLGSPHWFFLSEVLLGEGGRISTPHQFYWMFVSPIFFIIVSLLTKPASPKAIKAYCKDLQ
jgi:SSS family solute:Na+ symporter